MAVGFLLICIFSISIIVFYTLNSILNHRTKPWLPLTMFKVNQLPGPRSYPIIGNLFNILKTSEELWLYLRNLNKIYYPIYRMWSGPHAIVVFLCPDDIEILLSSIKYIKKSISYFPLRPWLGTGLLTSSGSKWHSRRKILTPAFHFNILRQFFGVFTEQSHLLIEELKTECGKDWTDIVPIISKFTLHSICETAMGTKLDSNNESHVRYIKSVYRMGELVLHQVLRPWLYLKEIYSFTKECVEKNQLVKFMHNFSMSVIQKRKEKFVADTANAGDTANAEAEIGLKKRLAMLDLLISAQNAGDNIDDYGIREEVDTFMFEGHDTTAMSLSFTLMLLANNSQVQENVVNELKEVINSSNKNLTYKDLSNLTYLEMVIKESLRLYPSVGLISRTIDEDIHTKTGYVVPKNVFVYVFIYDVHRNPKFYPEPTKFDPDRFLPENVLNRHPFAYIPFSAGPRNCIGQKFAVMELKIAILTILNNFILEPVDSPDDIVLLTDIVIRPKNGIKIKFKKRIQ